MIRATLLSLSHLTQLIVFKNWTEDSRVWHEEGERARGIFFLQPTALALHSTQKGNKLKGSGKLLKWKLFNFLQLHNKAPRRSRATATAMEPSKQLQHCILSNLWRRARDMVTCRVTPVMSPTLRLPRNTRISPPLSYLCLRLTRLSQSLL